MFLRAADVIYCYTPDVKARNLCKKLMQAQNRSSQILMQALVRTFTK